EKITAVTRRVSGFGENLKTEAGQNSVLPLQKLESNGPRHKTSPGRQQKKYKHYEKNFIENC
ncbi:MAG: hypothetical protein WC337_06130, partial [Candidatus Muiribacteriota bacterium]